MLYRGEFSSRQKLKLWTTALFLHGLCCVSNACDGIIYIVWNSSDCTHSCFENSPLNIPFSADQKVAVNSLQLNPWQNSWKLSYELLFFSRLSLYCLCHRMLRIVYILRFHLCTSIWRSAAKLQLNWLIFIWHGRKPTFFLYSLAVCFAAFLAYSLQ